MFYKDILKVEELHKIYNFKGPLLDAGGLNAPSIADYEISKNKAINIKYSFEGVDFSINAPHPIQNDRYRKITRPWSLIDQNYLILNPENGDPYIEELPKLYQEKFNTVIMVSVLEHVNNPFEVVKAIFKICAPGAYFFNSAPVVFPYHPSPNDNFRFSPNGLKLVHETSGFDVLESGFHVDYSTQDAIGDTNPENYGVIQPIKGSYILCRRPE